MQKPDRISWIRDISCVEKLNLNSDISPDFLLTSVEFASFNILFLLSLEMKENGQGLPEGEPPGQVSFFPELTFPLRLDGFTMKESWIN